MSEPTQVVDLSKIDLLFLLQEIEQRTANCNYSVFYVPNNAEEYQLIKQLVYKSNKEI
jgi:hypothetical protein